MPVAILNFNKNIMKKMLLLHELIMTGITGRKQPTQNSSGRIKTLMQTMEASTKMFTCMLLLKFIKRFHCTQTSKQQEFTFMQISSTLKQDLQLYMQRVK